MSKRSIFSRRPGAAGRRWRSTLALLFAGLLFTSAIAAASCSRSSDESQAGTGGGPRSTNAGNVAVKLSWDGPGSGLEFNVAMDTHSVDLDRFDLARLARLRTDSGTEVAPLNWDAKEGGHHRQGKLSFPPSVAGRPVLGDGVRGITIVVRDVASPERSFEWTW